MKVEFAKYLAIFITVIGMLVGATWLISDALADTKNWTLEQDTAIKNEVLNESDRRYTPREDFARIEAELKYMKEILSRIDRKLDRQQ